VIAYLGRYTHKIAITKHRIKEVTDTMIKFSYKDYADGNKTKEMWLSKEEFLRRFESHILPKRYVKIRHAGFLRHKNKTERLNKIRENLKLSEAPVKVKIPIAIRLLEQYGTDIGLCPCCKIGRMVLLKDTRSEGRTQKQAKIIQPAPV
jgi:Putative transposase